MHLQHTAIYSIAEFCVAHGISRGTLFKLWKEAWGPRCFKVGRRTLISREAAKEWLAQLEREAREANSAP